MGATHTLEGKLYSSDFFAGHDDVVSNTAATVVPMVLALTPISSVVDVGCGEGAWGAKFLVNGVADVWGIDGDYVNRDRLKIARDHFLARDLTRPIDFGRVVDLAVCLEVAEHLPESRARGLVADLTSFAPCILFSAAIPGQGGTHHVNEQFVSYWADLFEERGYAAIDPIRPRILGNDAVAWWYQQNIVMFIAPNHPLRERGFPQPRNIVHEYLYERFRVKPGLKLLVTNFAANLPGAIRRTVACYFGRRRQNRERRRLHRAEAAR